MLKAAATFLLLGLLASMVIRAVLPRPPGRKGETPRKVETATKCPRCGAYRLGDGQCPTPGCRGGR